MPVIVFARAAGSELRIEVPLGWTLMEGAVKNGIDGIAAECGGSCACATCHVYIDSSWADRLPEINGIEDELLACVEERRANSRLACQISIAEFMDGMRVEIPLSIK